MEDGVDLPPHWQLQAVCLGTNPGSDWEGAQPPLTQLPASWLPKVGGRQENQVTHRMLHRPPPAVMGGLLPTLGASQHLLCLPYQSTHLLGQLCGNRNISDALHVVQGLSHRSPKHQLKGANPCTSLLG